MDSPPLTNRVTAKIAPSTRLARWGSQTISVLALISFLLVVWPMITQSPLLGKPGWPEALLVLTTGIATLASLARVLPGEKVLLAGVVIGLLGGLAHGLGATTAFPFGPFVFSEAAGPRFFNVLAWPLPLIWMIAILNSRGVARLILRPWRKLKSYGFWLISLTALLVVLFALAFEPFATHINHYWLWLPTKFPFTWYGAPLVNFLGWLLTALLILAFTTPALTQKTAHAKNRLVDFHPLVIWLLALTLFGIGAFQNQLRLAAALCVLTGITTAVVAVRGARW